MSKPDICVVIPTYRREEVLLDTIDGILKQSHQNLELLVVDQSTEHSAETATALAAINDPRFRYYLADPPSLPAARNFALRHTKALIVLYLDDDITPDKDLVKYHLQAFKEHPDISAVAGRVLQKGFPIKKNVLSFDDYAISEGVFTATDATYTNAFPGGNCALKVEDALRVGGFDTRFYANAFREESDMALKMSRAGMKIYFEPRASLLHLATHSGGTRAATYTDILDTKMFYKNELFFTIRAVRFRNLPKALSKKYREYCRGRGRETGLRRSWYFGLGFLVACWRQLFGRQIITKERPS